MVQRVNFLYKLFSCKYMLKPKDIVGDVPSTREGYSTTINMAWPSIVESVLVSLMASVDTMMVGTINPEAIAAVGLTNQPRFIIMAAILSLNIGMTAVVSRRKGAEDYKGANSCLKQGMILSLLFSVVLSLIGIIFANPLMFIAGAEKDVIGLSSNYFKIIMVGVPFTALGLTINASQRGVGNTRISMTTNLTANLVNVVFNYLLINGVWIFPKMGVAGAGVATVLGNIVACFYSIHSVWTSKKVSYLDLTSKTSWKFDKQTILSLLNVGSSAMVEQVFMRVGFFVYAIMVAKLGTLAFATHQICMQILNISFAVGDGFSVAASSLVGQNLGAKRPDLSKLYVSICQRLALIVSTVIFFMFIFGQYFLVSLFTNDKQVIEEGAKILIIMAFTTHIQTSQVIVSGCLRGAGDTKYIAVVSFISVALVRPTLTWILCFPVGLGLIGAWIALLLDQSMRFISVFLRFLGGKWTKIKL